MTATTSAICALLLILILVTDHFNSVTWYLIAVFLVTIPFIYYLSSSVILQENGIVINSKLITWENLHRVELNKDLIITTVDQERYTIRYHHDYFNRILKHIKSAREDLFFGRFQSTFNNNFSERFIAELFVLLPFFIGVLFLLSMITFEYELSIFIVFTLIFVIGLEQRYHKASVILENETIEVQYLLKSNLTKSIDEIDSIKEYWNKNVEYINIRFNDGMDLKLPNFVEEAQFLSENLRSLRSQF